MTGSDASALPAVAQLHGHQRPGPLRVDNLTDLVGNTPLIRLHNIERECPGVELWAKAEFCNPGGSVKDRAAKRILEDALARGDIQPGMRLIDSTSGNTGIAYAMVGAALGVPITLVMPENVSIPRKLITTAYGVEIIYSSPFEGSDGAIVLAKKLVDENPDRYYYPDQYANPSNPLAHYDGTGVEIWQQTQGRVTHFVTGIGTSGTVVGTSRRLRDYAIKYGKDIQCIGIQPDDAMHGLEGMKHIPSSIVPPIYDESVLDDTIWMTTEDGWDMAERLA
ncbi:MAG: PLP-dependent cysteine synthase family protein, partial [Nannocystaceae bacterium]